MDSHTQGVPGPPPKGVSYTLNNIRIEGFPKRPAHVHKRYITVRINQGEVWEYRRLGIKQDSLEWKEPTEAKQFEASASFALELILYEIPVSCKKDRQVGSLTQAIALFLDAPKGKLWPLVMSANNQATLSVTIDIAERPRAPPNGSTPAIREPSDRETTLGEVVVDAPAAALESQSLVEADAAVDSGTEEPSYQVEIMGKVTAELTAAMPPLVKHGASSKALAVGDNIETLTKMFDWAKDTWEPLLNTLDSFMSVMNELSDLHPYAHAAWKVLTLPYNLYKEQKQCDEDVNELVGKIKEVYETMLDFESLRRLAKELKSSEIAEVQAAVNAQHPVLFLLFQQTEKCGAFILEYAKDRQSSCLKRMMSSPQKIIDQFGEKFEDLRRAFREKVIVHNEIIAVTIVKQAHGIDLKVDRINVKLENIGTDVKIIQSTVEDVHESVGIIHADIILKDLPYIAGVGCNSEKTCLDGTRTTILDGLKEWVKNTDEQTPRVRLLLGQAGTGKSTIAHTIACHFEKCRRLGAAFCFLSGSSDQLLHMFSTLARDLADFNPAFKQALLNEIGQKQSDRTTSDLDKQFELFIHKPTQNITLLGTVLILIEGLDESGDVPARKAMLRKLAENLHKLPRGFRVLLTARPESDILALFQPGCGLAIQHIDEARNDDTLRADIRKFIVTQLTKPDPRMCELNETHFALLTERSEGLFQWARVACDYINGSSGPRGGCQTDKFDDVTKSHGSAVSTADVLDHLYQSVIPRLLDLHDPRVAVRFKVVMGLVLHPMEPLNMEAVQDLARHVRESNFRADDVRDDVYNILSNLGSLLSGVTEGAPIKLRTGSQGKPSFLVQPLHSSFRDFLTSDSRSKDMATLIMKEAKEPNSSAIQKLNVDCYIGGPKTHHATLATACLGVLNSELHFNMCHLETSYRLNRDIPDLPRLLEVHIPVKLSYSSRYWGQHLSYAGADHTSILIANITTLLKCKYLYWLEALSLLGTVSTAASSLSSFIPHISNDVNLSDLARDCLRFVRNLGVVISQSAPHIYISALMSAPYASHVRRLYQPRFPHTARMCTGQRQHWPREDVFSGHGAHVNTVCYSHDDKYIASGSWDNTLRLWDATTGQLIGDPFTDYKDWVMCLAFSHDSTRIASGSDDGTIQVWDLATRKLWDAPPTTRHEKNARSVAFSHDSRRIVSVAKDGTLGVWNAETGHPIIPLRKCHEREVLSVVFSPESTQILSGSRDRDVQVRCSATGDLIRRVPTSDGENDEYEWIALSFSPDGKRFASGSWDGIVRVWDINTGNLLAKPFGDHTRVIRALSFSHDGELIVSGSEDKTARIWDAKSGKPVGGILEGHASFVLSVAFSHDNKRVVTGSSDSTVRLWDVEADNIARANFEEDIEDVKVESRLHGRNRVAIDEWMDSFWYVESGGAPEAFHEGHAGSIVAVAFSHDGTRVVSGSDDGTIRVWNANTGVLVGSPFRHDYLRLRLVAFLSDNNRIITGSQDGTIDIWDAAVGVLLGKLPSGGYLGALAFSFSLDSTCFASQLENTI